MYDCIDLTSTVSFQARTLPVLGKRAVPELQNLVSVDFWESYDPEEVCNTGFGLIGSEPFHVRATCFLCGSAGREKVRLWYYICMCEYITFISILHIPKCPHV